LCQFWFEAKCIGITAVQLLLQEKVARCKRREVQLYPVYLGVSAFELQGNNSS